MSRNASYIGCEKLGPAITVSTPSGMMPDAVGARTLLPFDSTALASAGTVRRGCAKSSTCCLMVWNDVNRTLKTERGGKKRAKCSAAAARKKPGTSVLVDTCAGVTGALTGAFSAATKNAPKNESDGSS